MLQLLHKTSSLNEPTSPPLAAYMEIQILSISLKHNMTVKRWALDNSIISVIEATRALQEAYSFAITNKLQLEEDHLNHS